MLKISKWFLSIITFTAATLIAVYTIPEDAPTSLMILRFILGFIFLSFIPGHCLFRALFPKESRKNIIEEIVLSVTLSFSITGLICLILGVTNVGLSINSIAISVTVIVLILSSLSTFTRSIS